MDFRKLIPCVLYTLVMLALTGCGSEPSSDADQAAPVEEPVARSQTATAPQEQADYALQLAVDLADTWLATYEPRQNAWSWDAGVFMMGLMDLYEVTGDQRYYDYTKAWVDYYIENGYFITSSDNSIPGFTALRLYENEGDSKYLQVADDVWYYISEVAGRTSEGGLNHLGLISGNQIWVDSLFMIGPFLMKYAEIKNITAPYDEYALQLSVFRKNLRDPDTGLYRHMYDDTEKTTKPVEPNFWGRGNGWVFVGYQVAGHYLPATVQSGLGFSIQQDRDHMLNTLINSPQPDGRFHTILNAPQTYQETSAGLLYAYGLYLDMQLKGRVVEAEQRLAERWIQGAINESTRDALGNTLLLGTSYGTSPGSLEYYNQVLKGENVAYGVGLYLLATSAREQVGALSLLTQSNSEPSEHFIQPPVPCEGVACGRFHIARGNFTAAVREFSSVPEDPEARFFQAAIETVRMGFDAFFQIDRLAVGDISGEELIDWVNQTAYPQADHISELLAPVKQESAFSASLDRLLILESGGHTAIGAREYDLGEVYLFDALAQVVTGVAMITGADPSVLELRDHQQASLSQAIIQRAWKQDNQTLQGLIQVTRGLDSLILALEVMAEETDDQSDDLVPANVVRLEGTITIPGLLLETDVRDLLTGLGLTEAELDKINAPDDLITLLRTVASTLKVVATLLDLII